jgi:peptidoglycan/xylan/chitin deacetylase (PgdA/CDA1 family)
MERRYPCKVLSYHRVLPAEMLPEQYTQQSLMIDVALFRQQMLFLREKYHFLTADALVMALESGKGFREPSCVLTFDDGWRDNFLFAFPILKELNIPAILFAAVNHVETGKDFWPERLTRLLLSSGLRDGNANIIRKLLPVTQIDLSEENLREYANAAAIALKSRSLDEIEQVLDVLACELKHKRSSIRTERAICYWHELREMVDSKLITIGSHTLSHSILPREQTERQERECLESKTILERKLEVPVRHFAYPNGSFNAEAERIIRSSGYRSAFTCLNGVNYRGASPYRIRRIHISNREHRGNGFSKFQFALRISAPLQAAKSLRNALNAKPY